MKIGKIISVEYDKFKVRLFHSTRNSTVNIDGKVYYFGNIGSYLKTSNSLGDSILCEVTAVTDWINTEKISYSNYDLDSSREVIIKPIGTLAGHNFKMGVRIFPSLYSDVEIVTYNDLDKVLSLNDEKPKNSIHTSINIGQSKNLINYNINLDINKLFNIHTAVLGNSGSGKSNTIAHILHEVYRKNDNHANGAKTIIFDANGEYPIALGENSGHSKHIDNVCYKPNIEEDGEDGEDGMEPLYLPYYLMNLDEWLSFLMASERTQKPFWDKVLQECFKFYKIFNGEDDAELFANYVKWKLYQMLYIIVTRIESDTSKMTAAKGAIAKMQDTCTQVMQNSEASVFKDLKIFLDICNKLCYVSYGNNNDALANALHDFISDGENPQYVKLDINMKISLYDEKERQSFRQIDEERAIIVNEENLKSGQYFDYKFLKIATEIVLMEEEARGNLHIRDFISTLLSRLDYFLENQDCKFMREQKEIYQSANDYLDKVFGISDSQERTKQLITIDLSDVGIDVLELLTNVLSRMIFDYRKQRLGHDRRERPVHLILDEAHRYIRNDANYIMRENIFEKIAREGRKYSLYLIISSQRPSELSQTVLSQCGNYIVHRIQNEIDMKYIYSVLPYFSDDYITKIKQAIPGEALVFGNCVPMPLMIKVVKANPAPNSDNCVINEEWFKI